MRVWWLTTVLFISALAGCTDDGGTDGDDTPVGEEEGPVDGNDGDNTEPSPIPDLDEAVKQDWFFTTSFGLQNETPTEGTVALVGGFSTFVTGTPFASFRSDPVSEPTLILPEAIDVDLYYQTSVPGSYNAAFSYGIWAGSTQSMPLSQVGQASGPVLPDAVNHLAMTLDWEDRLPVLVEPGQSIQLIITINVDGAADAGAVSLLVGGEDTASKASITTQTMNIDPLASESMASSETYSGTLVTSQPMDCQVAEGVSQAFHEVPVGADVTFLRAQSSGSDLSGSADLDIDLLDGTTVLGGGHTATATEGILWGGPDFEKLRGSTLTLRVTICLAAQMDYDVVVTQG